MEGTERGLGSFLVLEDEATVLRAKLGTSEGFLELSVTELLFSEEVCVRALMVERHIFSSCAGLGMFRRGLALGLLAEAFLADGSRVHFEALQVREVPL